MRNRNQGIAVTDEEKKAIEDAATRYGISPSFLAYTILATSTDQFTSFEVDRSSLLKRRNRKAKKVA